MSTTREQLIGKCFISPVADYVLIGAAWTFIVAALFLYQPLLIEQVDLTTLYVIGLFANSAHFAASTVRLYSKPSYYQEYSFLALALPVIAIVVVSVCIVFPELLGRHLQALYLTWSPYHYAAQTYGLSVMYCARSGLKLERREQRFVFWTCLMPFLSAFLRYPETGLRWFISQDTIEAVPGFATAVDVMAAIVFALTFALPAILFYTLYKNKGRFMPGIALVMMASNGLWWTAFTYYGAFVLATFAHAIQYLAIMLIFHVRERLRQPDNRHGWLHHAVVFYTKCLALGYALFYCWPYAYVLAGAGVAESVLLVIATINIHHFIVDRYIWRLRSPSNAPTLIDTPTAAPATRGA